MALLPPLGFAQEDAVGGRSRPILVNGSCPQAGAIEKVLSTMLPQPPSTEEQPRSGPSPPAVTVVVSDRGEKYVVSVGDRAKTYVDSTRNCVERARVAAVFIALALAPDADAEEASSAQSKTQVPPPRGAGTSPGGLPRSGSPDQASFYLATPWLRVDARGALAIATAHGLAAPGGELGMAFGASWLGASARCAVFAGTSLDVGGDSVLLQRFPCALGPMARLFPGSSRLELNFAAGAVLGALRVSGRSFFTNLASTRLEVGARVAADAALHWGSASADLAPLVGVELTYDPAVYDLDVQPRGAIAQTPAVWVGVTVGATWSVK